MTFGERMKEMFEQGALATKDFAVKAGAKAQDLGERGVLMVEVKQLELQAQKFISRLGAEAYQAFSERGETVLSRDSAPVEALLKDIAVLKDSIEKKEALLAEKKNRK